MTELDTSAGLRRVLAGYELPEQLFTGVRYIQDLRAWAVFSYQDVTTAFGHPDLSAERDDTYFGMLPADVRQELEPLRQFYARWMVFSEGAQNTVGRRIVRAWIDPNARDDIRAHWQTATASLVARRSGEVDVLDRLVRPATRWTALRMLRQDDTDLLREFEAQATDIFRFTITGTPRPELGRLAMNALKALRDLVPLLLAERGEPHVASDQLDDVIAALTNVWLATVHPLGAAAAGTLDLLATVPGLRVQAERHGVKSVVEEALRLISPFVFAARRATASLELARTPIPANGRVLLFLAAANRDPQAFHSPADCIPDRAGPLHLAFGKGRHYCIGPHFAREAMGGVIDAWLSSRARIAPVQRTPVPALGINDFERLVLDFRSAGQ